VCGLLAEAFDYGSVSALQYDCDAEEVTEIAFVGDAPAGGHDHEPVANVPSLEQARDTQNLVLASFGDAPSIFVLPLVAGNGCLAFLYGTRRKTVVAAVPDREALSSVALVAATLLEDAFMRDEMRELDRARSEYVALASHELRNPLASIYGISMTLHEHDAKMSEAVRLTLRDALRDQTIRMRTLVEQLLDLSRLDVASIRVAPEHVRLRPAIEELVRPLADTRPDAVTIAVPDDLEVVLDPVALDRTLSNLIANSLRHGRPPVTVSANAQDRHLRLAVEDRGDGVPSEFVPRLFDRFARGSDGVDGSGLGLAIAQAYARAQGGEIVYRRAVPHGARFEVVIPLRTFEDRLPGPGSTDGAGR
jgi:signal transduction histidine kinase